MDGSSGPPTHKSSFQGVGRTQDGGEVQLKGHLCLVKIWRIRSSTEPLSKCPCILVLPLGTLCSNPMKLGVADCEGPVKRMVKPGTNENKAKNSNLIGLASSRYQCILEGWDQTTRGSKNQSRTSLRTGMPFIDLREDNRRTNLKHAPTCFPLPPKEKCLNCPFPDRPQTSELRTRGDHQLREQTLQPKKRRGKRRRKQKHGKTERKNNATHTHTQKKKRNKNKQKTGLPGGAQKWDVPTGRPPPPCPGEPAASLGTGARRASWAP